MVKTGWQGMDEVDQQVSICNYTPEKTSFGSKREPHCFLRVFLDTQCEGRVRSYISNAPYTVILPNGIPGKDMFTPKRDTFVKLSFQIFLVFHRLSSKSKAPCTSVSFSFSPLRLHKCSTKSFVVVGPVRQKHYS